MRFQGATLILLLWPSISHQRSFENSPTYVAGIVEYSPVVTSDEEENLGPLNTDNYLKIIDKAVTYDLDVMVFPESSLSISIAKNATVARSQAASYIPDPSENVIPCNNTYYQYSLSSISCAAKEHKIYIVINHREKVDCTPDEEGCPNDGLLIYNTNVVFDRNGQVIARYRKYNLFVEYGVNRTEPIPTTFKTDFGVTFGTFICFDLLFQTPTLNLTRDLGITDIVYPTHWFSRLPYVYAVESQAAWAYANDVNFLASSYNYPKTASGGAGIFLGKQGHVKVISEKKRSNILVVAEIPKVIDGKRTKNIDNDKVHIYEFTNKEITTGDEPGSEDWMYTNYDVSVYSSELIDMKQKSYNKTVCNQGFCCNFKLKIEFDESITLNDSNYLRYRFATFNGTSSLSYDVTGGTTTCGIMACMNHTFESCGQFSDNRTITPIVFTSLEISTSDIKNENALFVPVTLSQKMVPLNVTDFNFKSVNSGQYSTYHMKLTKPVNNLLEFAIGGRDFSRDGTQVTHGILSTS